MYWLFRKLGDHVINRGIEKMKRAGDKQQIRSGCVLPVACKLKSLLAMFLGKARAFNCPLGKIIHLPDKARRKIQVPL